MKICIDIDGVICTLRQQHETYADVKPMPGAAEKINALRKQGHYIILHTARHMKSCDGNVGKVVARQGAVTLSWLAKNGIEYDEIFFGKPHADVYLDDNAMRFEDWKLIANDGSSFPLSSEKRAKAEEQ